MRQNFEVSKQLTRLIEIHQKRIALYREIVRQLGRDRIVFKAILDEMIEDSREAVNDIREEYFEPFGYDQFRIRNRFSIYVYAFFVRMVGPYFRLLPLYVIRSICRRQETKTQRQYSRMMRESLSMPMRQHIISQQTRLREGLSVLNRYREVYK